MIALTPKVSGWIVLTADRGERARLENVGYLKND